MIARIIESLDLKWSSDGSLLYKSKETPLFWNDIANV